MIKDYEKDLLNNLTGEFNNGEEPLKNVKQALGSLSQVVGNPLFKAEISLQISLGFSDNLGNVVAPAALPAGLQTSIPVYLLGLTDYYSGYPNALRIANPQLGWFFGGALNTVGIFGLDTFGAYPGLNPVAGDMILQYADALAANFATIVVHCNNIAYGTFLNSFVSDLITLNLLRVIVPAANINQLINPLIFGYQTLFGKLTTDSIDPRMYKTPADFQNQIADIPVTLPIDKNIIIGFQMDVFCPTVDIVFSVQKVEPLTHIRKIKTA